jgi:hypothetical protein
MRLALSVVGLFVVAESAKSGGHAEPASVAAAAATAATAATAADGDDDSTRIRQAKTVFKQDDQAEGLPSKNAAQLKQFLHKENQERIGWKQAGEIDTLLKHAKKAEIAKHYCQDTSSDCGAMAKLGFCNPVVDNADGFSHGFLLRDCPKSCSRCAAGANTPHGSERLEPGCRFVGTRNPLTPPVICDHGSEACADKLPGCKMLAASGYCNAVNDLQKNVNSSFILRDCPMACHRCSKVDPFIRKQEMSIMHTEANHVLDQASKHEACTDTSPVCADVAKLGFCKHTVDNADGFSQQYLLRDCRKSCGRCAQGANMVPGAKPIPQDCSWIGDSFNCVTRGAAKKCIDKSPRCVKLARDHPELCKKQDTAARKDPPNVEDWFVLRDCEESCGTCMDKKRQKAIAQHDQKTALPSLTRRAHSIATHPSSTHDAAPQADCVDHADCESKMKADGLCDSKSEDVNGQSQGYLMRSCPKMCGRCGSNANVVPGALTNFVEGCFWQNGKLQCDVGGRAACTDKSVDCPVLKTKGYCSAKTDKKDDLQRSFIMQDCRKTCNACEESHATGPRDPLSVFTDHSASVKDATCPSAFEPNSKSIYKFKRWEDRHGCCILDRVLSLMELKKSISACKHENYHGSKPPVGKTTFHENTGLFTEDGLASPCMLTKVKELADQIRSCCCLASSGTPDKCDLDHQCVDIVAPVLNYFTRTVAYHYQMCAMGKEHMTMMAHQHQLRHCSQAENSAITMIQYTLRTAQELYKHAPLADVTEEGKTLIHLCDGKNMLQPLSCRKRITYFTKLMFPN